MANEFLSKGKQTTNSYAAIYTAAAGVTTVVLALQCANIDASAAYKIYVKVVDASDGSTSYILLNGASVSAGAAVDAIAGKLVLNTGDAIQIYSDTTAKFECFISYMEMTA